MYTVGKNIAEVAAIESGSKKNVWSIVLQVLIAALTALTGVLAGCKIAG